MLYILKIFYNSVLLLLWLDVFFYLVLQIALILFIVLPSVYSSSVVFISDWFFFMVSMCLLCLLSFRLSPN